MIEILQIVLPVFIVLLLGWVIKRYGLIDDSFIATANKLIFNICLPVLLFYKISQADLRAVFNPAHIGIMMFSVVVIFFFSFGAGFLLKTKNSTGTMAMNTFRANYAYMGLPVSAYAYGEKGLVIASVLMAFVVPFVNFMSVVALSISMKGEKSFKPFIKNTLFNPLAIACMLGLLSSWLEISYPRFFDRSLSIISGVTLPLALFCVGGSMSLEKLKGDMFLAGFSSAIKLFALPVVAYIMLKMTTDQIGVAEKVVVIMLSAPTATVNYVLASAMEGDSTLAGSTIVMSTLLSIFSFSLWLFLLG
jgi:predicted permease